MIDSYIILHRKPSIIMKTFLFNIFLIGIIVIWSINTFYYQTSFQFHSKILNFNSFYYLEVLIPVKEVKQITKQNQIIIDGKLYYYQIYKVDNNVLYKNSNNYQKVYLEISNLEKEYQKNGYQMDVQFLGEKKKIIDYLKE